LKELIFEVEIISAPALREAVDTAVNELGMPGFTLKAKSLPGLIVR
jgi:hypothetical protein